MSSEKRGPIADPPEGRASVDSHSSNARARCQTETVRDAHRLGLCPVAGGLRTGTAQTVARAGSPEERSEGAAAD